VSFIFLVNFINSGLYGNNGITCSGGSCRQRTTVIAGSIVGAGIGLILCLLAVWLCYRRCKGRPLKSNRAFVLTTADSRHARQPFDSHLFKSGVWSSRYLQDGKCHGPHRCLLSFDYQTLKVSGSGNDNNGVFVIDGIISMKTGRMGLNKTYTSTLSQSSAFFQSQILIQLVWNTKNSQFEGKWYVHTKNYRAENKFYLKYNQQQLISLYETL
jgi:hypothetical protein